MYTIGMIKYNNHIVEFNRDNIYIYLQNNLKLKNNSICFLIDSEWRRYKIIFSIGITKLSNKEKKIHFFSEQPLL